jgi:hypothetical protein
VSSAGFETILVPAIRLRRAVLAFAAAAALGGVVLIVSLPLRPAFKALVALLWVARSLLETASQVRGMGRIERIRISAGGSVEALSRSGKANPLTLLSGSVVLSRIAWLRLSFGDGLRYGELLTGNPRRDDEWRRLQLIWRQQAAAFGGPEGS